MSQAWCANMFCSKSCLYRWAIKDVIKCRPKTFTFRVIILIQDEKYICLIPDTLEYINIEYHVPRYSMRTNIRLIAPLLNPIRRTHKCLIKRYAEDTGIYAELTMSRFHGPKPTLSAQSCQRSKIPLGTPRRLLFPTRPFSFSTTAISVWRNKIRYQWHPSNKRTKVRVLHVAYLLLHCLLYSPIGSTLWLAIPQGTRNREARRQSRGVRKRRIARHSKRLLTSNHRAVKILKPRPRATHTRW